MTDPELTPAQAEELAAESRVSLEEARRLAADAVLTRAAVKASGLSARRFAVDILVRDERTVRRWLAGDSPLPKAVRDKLSAIVQNMPP